MKGEPGRYSTRVGIGKGGSQLKVGGQTDGGIPAVGDETYAVLLRHPGDATLFADAADFGDVGLDDVEGARLPATAGRPGGASALRLRRWASGNARAAQRSRPAHRA